NVPPRSLVNNLFLHDALPIYCRGGGRPALSASRRSGRSGSASRRLLAGNRDGDRLPFLPSRRSQLRSFHPRFVLLLVGVGFSPADRKSTRLNSRHDQISYAVF